MLKRFSISVIILGIVLITTPIYAVESFDTTEKNQASNELSAANKELANAESKLETELAELENINNQVISLENSITTLQSEITKTEKLVYTMLPYIQKTMNGTYTIETIFTNTDNSDFIRTINASEEMISTANDAIELMISQVTQLNSQKVELVSLQEAQTQKVAEVATLQAEAAANQQNASISYEEEVAEEQAYRDRLGCNQNETTQECTERVSKPPSTSGGFILPVSSGYVSCAYGNSCYAGHNGVDFGSAGDDTIYAAAPGTVAVTNSGCPPFYPGMSSCGSGGYGNYVVINHSLDLNGDGTYEQYSTMYAHLSQVNVSPGMTVGYDTVIGKKGDSGNSSAEHLHFEIRNGYSTSSNNHRQVNPANYMYIPPQGAWFNSRN